MTGTLALGACARMDLDEYNGSFNHWDRPYKAGEEYMVSIAKQLLPDCLIALEDALIYDNYGYYNQSTPREKLNYSQWLNTYKTARGFLSGEQPNFEGYRF